MAAAAAQWEGGKQAALVVWDTVSGAVLYNSAEAVTAIAVSNDPKHLLLATGTEDGEIKIRTLPKGNHVTTMRAGRIAIRCLAIQLSSHGGPPGDPLGSSWLLATGDASGTITVWNTARLSAVCHGSNHHIHAVTLSPDGATLASVGRRVVRLWDTASGRLLFELPGTNILTDVAFSSDGRRVAATGIPAFGSPGIVALWELEPGRGIQTLRGLAAQVEKVTFSPDERLVAALDHSSRVAVWDLSTGALRHLFDAPRADWVDNAALAFSPDSQRLAYSGSSESKGRAKLWDIQTGEELGSWNFSPGLDNILAFQGKDKFLLLQKEARAGKGLPGVILSPRQAPCIRAYELLGKNTTRQLYEIAQFNWRIEWLVASTDGRVAALVGKDGDKAVQDRQVFVFDGLTGKPILPPKRETTWSQDEHLALGMDHSGRYLTIRRRSPGGETATRIELPSGKDLGPCEPIIAPPGWSPEMPYRVRGVDPSMFSGKGVAFFRPGETRPVVVLGIDVRNSGVQHQFTIKGTRYAWGNVDGTVNVADLLEVQRRLNEVGLGWR